MNMQEVKSIAKARGVKLGKLKKLELIRAIQADEGNTECFATDVNNTCDQLGCLWRDDCQELSKKNAS